MLATIDRSRKSVSTCFIGTVVKVRIKATPDEPEMDGMKLNHMVPGSVVEVAPSLGSWLVVQGYAELEMRTTRGVDFNAVKDRGGRTGDRRNRQ
jgi:hypothetical protein